MERLTHIDHIGWYIEDQSVAFDGRRRGRDVGRLAAYEDIGLEPEEVTAIKHALMGRETAKITELDGIPVRRLRELARAEKDGRLVMLPCDKVRWVKAILAERDRQDQKWGYPQKNSFCEWASIIAEEVGELSKELNELNFGRGTLNQMEAEAVQVAAVALSILEQSAVAHMVTVQVAVALSRLTREETETALKKRGVDIQRAGKRGRAYPVDLPRGRLVEKRC